MLEEDTISIYQLAESLGVSTTTVSRVLNHRAGIGAETRDRVWAAARKAGYRPKQSVRRTTIGLVVNNADPDAVGAFVPQLTTRVMAQLARHDVVLEVFSRGSLKTMTRRYLDGVLAIAWEKDSIAALRSVTGVPVVIFNRPEHPEFSLVCSDYRGGGEQVAQVMLEHGHRRIGFLGGQSDTPTDAMLGGMQQCLQEAGVPMPLSAVAYTHGQPPYAAVRRLVDQGITALFICTADLSYQVPYLCSELMGLDLPRDLSIVGFDDALRHMYSHPPLSVATENTDALIAQALNMLMDQVAKRDPAPRRATVPVDVILRESLQRISQE